MEGVACLVENEYKTNKLLYNFSFNFHTESHFRFKFKFSSNFLAMEWLPAQMGGGLLIE